ncbi:alternate-type signal peptide domain-containing protein [Cellulomonas sp. KH9]|uniref:alternate-type signal peptide domain-containing protein n=1 Tax=Cellulomonas sp. KH9 TaxID=1855324 RepID=UPI0008F0FDF9|nr:alternate-type signal peptide domain-containing protein [Cellulomonas sp. KH9]SFJ80579.1 alternate signal-mediated exported protein, RER_14450 family [Cellulomonas sp. KH9]
MKNRTKGVIAGAAGVALLAGGTTFALWSDSASVAGGVITNGNLDVAPVGTPAWQDVSDDRADGPHAIDIDTWRMVPGDVAEGTYGFQVALEGDNLVAELKVDTADPAATLPTGMSVTYDVRDADGKVLASDVALGADTTLRFRAPREGRAAGSPTDTDAVVVDRTEVKTGADATANLTVVVTATFAYGTPDQVSVQETTTLGGLAVTLEQVRSGTDFTATTPTPAP